jgi:hypothetical protein
MKWVRHVARMRGVINADEILVGKYEGKRPLERPIHRRKYNIIMILKET